MGNGEMKIARKEGIFSWLKYLFKCNSTAIIKVRIKRLVN